MPALASTQVITGPNPAFGSYVLSAGHDDDFTRQVRQVSKRVKRLGKETHGVEGRATSESLHVIYNSSQAGLG